MKYQIQILLITILCAFSVNLEAKVKLPSIFGNGMVLQQQTEVAIWGTANEKAAVNVVTSWNNQSYKTKADEKGKWKLKVKTPEAGGPYSITISDGEKIVLSDILIGEVWVCSGQSNMEMPVKGYKNQPVLGSNKTIATSSNPEIRLFNVKKQKTVIPQEDFTGLWTHCEPEYVANISATAYYFGRMLQDVLKVPVGIICSSWGGTNIVAWTSENSIKQFNWLELPSKDQESPDTNAPTVLFNGMINPMVGYGMRGVIWYQGESNRNEPENYFKYMKGIMDNWRSLWNIGDFPFYFCQIAPYGYNDKLNSAFLREVQQKASFEAKNSGMACLMDVGEEFCIHPADKEAAGDRLAYIALAKTYNKKGFAYSGPVYKSMSTEGSVIKLSFDFAENGLTTFGKPLTNFIIAGDDQKFYPANAYLTRDGLFVSSPRVNKPVAVRYAWEHFVVGELFNTEGLPASSFRTDDWEVQ